MNPRVITLPSELGEPVLGSVVLDRDQRAWQRYLKDDGTSTTWGSYGWERDVKWGVLLTELGPLTAIYEPDYLGGAEIVGAAQ